MRQLYIGYRIKGFKKFFEIGKRFNLSPEAQHRLLVIKYYTDKGQRNTSKTARYFGIHRNTVHKWLKKYDAANLHLLEPKNLFLSKDIEEKLKNRLLKEL